MMKALVVLLVLLIARHGLVQSSPLDSFGVREHADDHGAHNNRGERPSSSHPRGSTDHAQEHYQASKLDAVMRSSSSYQHHDRTRGTYDVAERVVGEGSIEGIVHALEKSPVPEKARKLAERDSFFEDAMVLQQWNSVIPPAAGFYDNVMAMSLFMTEFNDASVKLSLDGTRFPAVPRLVAKRQVLQGEVLMEAAAMMVLDFQRILELDPDLASLNTVLAIHPREAMVMFMLRERGDQESFWITYLEVIRDLQRWGRTPDSPLFWSQEELAELQSSVVMSMVAAERQKLIDRFLHLETELFQYRRDVFPEVLFTPELWVEWSMLINSRCWERSNWESVHDETRKDYFFAPFVDLLRHGAEENSPKALFMNDIRERYPSVQEHRAYFEGKYSGQNHFVIIAQRDYDIGDEVTIDYGYSSKGGHDNQHLLVNYGIYVQGNPNRVVSLYWSLSFSDVVSEQLLLPHLSELPFISLERGVAFVELRSNLLAVDLLVICRVSAMQFPDDFEALQRKGFENGTFEAFSTPISLANELDAIRLGISIVQSHLDTYDTSLREDQEIVEAAMFNAPGMLSWRYENALRLRMEEKEVHLNAIELLREAWARYLHSFNLNDVERSITDVPLLKREIDHSASHFDHDIVHPLVTPLQLLDEDDVSGVDDYEAMETKG